MSDKSIIREYLKKYRKKHGCYIKTKQLLKFLKNRFTYENTYSFRLIGRHNRIYSVDFKNIIFQTEYIVLILKKSGVLISGPYEVMKKINIVQSYLDNNFKEKAIKINIKDDNNISQLSCSFIESNLLVEQIFYEEVGLLSTLETIS